MRAGVSNYFVDIEGNCPNSYAYAFDESSGTALWTCDSGALADYTVIFCPAMNDMIQCNLGFSVN